MFQLFFFEYKRKIYNTFSKAFKRLPVLPKILFVIGIALAFGIGIAFIAENSLIIELLLGVSGLWSLLVFIAGCIYQKKFPNDAVAQYKNDTLKPLKCLLKDERYDLYSVIDVDWLISSCEAEIAAGERTLGAFGTFSVFVIPIVVALTSAVINNSASFAFAAGFVLLILFVWLLLCLLKFLLVDVIDYIRFPNRKALLSLKSDLQYLALELKRTEAKNPTVDNS